MISVQIIRTDGASWPVRSFPEVPRVGDTLALYSGQEPGEPAPLYSVAQVVWVLPENPEAPTEVHVIVQPRDFPYPTPEVHHV